MLLNVVIHLLRLDIKQIKDFKELTINFLDKYLIKKYVQSN